MQYALLVPLLVFALLVLPGCSAQVIPPAGVRQPVTVYVLDYGHHSSLVLPDSNGTGTEYAFGDWAYMAQNHDSLASGLRALLMSNLSTLGRRDLPATRDEHRLLAASRARRLVAVPVEQERAELLRAQLEGEFEAQRPTLLHNPITGIDFVHNTRRYRLFHNCNHVTAEWLLELGCELRGSAMGSAFRRADVPRPGG